MTGIRPRQSVLGGFAAGFVLPFTSDIGYMTSAVHAVVQQGLGVNFVFRLGPAAVGAQAVFAASHLFHRGRFGPVVAAAGGRMQTWRAYWGAVATGAILAMAGGIIGSYLGGGLVTGQWAPTGPSPIPRITGAGAGDLAVIVGWSSLVLVSICLGMSTIGMAIRSRFVAAFLPALAGLAISTIPELGIGSFLDWNDRAGVFGPPTTSWQGGVAVVVTLVAGPVLIAYALSVRQLWQRPWT